MESTANTEKISHDAMLKQGHKMIDEMQSKLQDYLGDAKPETGTGARKHLLPPEVPGREARSKFQQVKLEREFSQQESGKRPSDLSSLYGRRDSSANNSRPSREIMSTAGRNHHMTDLNIPRRSVLMETATIDDKLRKFREENQNFLVQSRLRNNTPNKQNQFQFSETCSDRSRTSSRPPTTYLRNPIHIEEPVRPLLAEKHHFLAGNSMPSHHIAAASPSFHQQPVHSQPPSRLDLLLAGFEDRKLQLLKSKGGVLSPTNTLQMNTLGQTSYKTLMQPIDSHDDLAWQSGKSKAAKAAKSEVKGGLKKSSLTSSSKKQKPSQKASKPNNSEKKSRKESAELLLTAKKIVSLCQKEKESKKPPKSTQKLKASTRSMNRPATNHSKIGSAEQLIDTITDLVVKKLSLKMAASNIKPTHKKIKL